MALAVRGVRGPRRSSRIPFRPHTTLAGAASHQARERSDAEAAIHSGHAAVMKIIASAN
jgi:hypothetical protein